VHLIAAIAAVPAVAALFVHARSGAASAAAVYGAALVALLTTSAVYHTPNWPPRIRTFLRRMDHSMIYVLIAGSYTPFCLELGGTASNLLLPVVWAAALLGAIKSVVWVNAPRIITAAPYVLLGWAIVPYMSDFHAVIGPAVLALIAAGGLMYTIGAVTYARKWPDPAPLTFGYHEIFHVLVVAAAACHYAAVWITVS